MNSGHRISCSGSIAQTPSCSEDMVSHVGMKQTHVLVAEPYGHTLARNPSVGNHSSSKGPCRFIPGLPHQKRGAACDACLLIMGHPSMSNRAAPTAPNRAMSSWRLEDASHRFAVPASDLIRAPAVLLTPPRLVDAEHCQIEKIGLSQYPLRSRIKG